MGFYAWTTKPTAGSIIYPPPDLRYAPTSAGTSGYILQSAGGTSDPTWLNILGTAHGGTGNSSFTATRLVYTPSATQLASTSITSDGSYIRNVGGYNNTSYALSTASFICNSWVRTKGSTGWYNEDYGGGWFMENTTWIKNYGSKKVLINNEVVSSSANGFRLSNGNYGVILRNDGSYFYFLLTNSGSSLEGSWNSLRPFYFDLTNGVCYSRSQKIVRTSADGTANHIAYYNAADSITSDSYIIRDNTSLTINRPTEAVALGYRLKNKPTGTNGYSVMFHLAASGNRGIYEDFPLSNWLMYWTTSNVAYIPNGGLWVGNSSLTSECNVSCEAKAGRVYLYSQGTDSGTMGIYSTGQAIIYRNHAGTLYLGNTIYGSHYYMSHSCYVNYNNDSNYGVFIGSTGNNNSGARVRAQTHLNTLSMWIDGSGNAGLYHNGSVSGPANKWLIWHNTSGTVSSSISDKRSKIDKGMLDKNETLNILNELPIINFVYKEDVENHNLEQSGIYAQDLRDILLKYNYPNRNIILLSPIITDEDYSDQKIKLAEEFRRVNIDQNLNLDENSEEYKEKEEIYFKDHLVECEKDGRIEYDLELPEEEYEYNINYAAMIPYLIKGWQIQQEQITQQQETIESLESRIAQLEQIILNQNN